MVPTTQAPTRPEETIDASAVRAWIAEALLGRPHVHGPIVVHRSNAWGLTARFATRGGAVPPEVVFKANFLPHSFTGAAVYDLLGRHCPDDVPDLIVWVEHPRRRWELFRVFEGDVVGLLGELNPLLEVARTMARIQVAVAALSPSEMSHLPRLSVQLIPDVFDAVLRDVERRCLPEWQRDGGAFARAHHLPSDVMGHLEAAWTRVAGWAADLTAGEWPLSVHHADLHANNAVRRTDGSVLIYDWEEADIGFPFFSLDKLLMASADLPGYGDTEEHLGDVGAAQVRAAYLDAVPWGSRTDRERAFDVALLLSPIRYAYAALRFATALGWSPAEITAGWIALALRRWGASAL